MYIFASHSSDRMISTTNSCKCHFKLNKASKCHFRLRYSICFLHPDHFYIYFPSLTSIFQHFRSLIVFYCVKQFEDYSSLKFILLPLFSIDFWDQHLFRITLPFNRCDHYLNNTKESQTFKVNIIQNSQILFNIKL